MPARPHRRRIGSRSVTGRNRWVGGSRRTHDAIDDRQGLADDTMGIWLLENTNVWAFVRFEGSSATSATGSPGVTLQRVAETRNA